MPLTSAPAADTMLGDSPEGEGEGDMRQGELLLEVGRLGAGRLSCPFNGRQLLEEVHGGSGEALLESPKESREAAGLFWLERECLDMSLDGEEDKAESSSEIGGG